MAPPPKEPPKGKKKKKTKEELEEERRLAEQAAKLAEEERLRLEELERARLAEVERVRQELLNEYLAVEAARVDTERQDNASLLGQLELERSTANEQRQEARSWERYLSCTYVPHPRQRVAVSDFMTAMTEAVDAGMMEALDACQQCRHVIHETSLYRAEAIQESEMAAAAQYEKDIAAFHHIIGLRVDHATAQALHHVDENVNERGEVQLGLQRGDFQWGLWINVGKNSRLKAVDMPQLHLALGIPKSIALANIALRVQHRRLDEFERRCVNGFRAAAGVFYCDLLSLPPPAKKCKGWVLRQVTPMTANVVRIPYPIPPAGADPATWVSEEEVLPLSFRMPLAPDVMLLEDPCIMGWWDAAIGGWSSEGFSDVVVNKAASTLSFKTTHLAPLALIVPRAKLLPYRSWNVRPTGGLNGKSVALTLDVGLAESVVFEVTPGAARLLSPIPPELSAMAGRSLAPAELLLQLSAHGLHLMPMDADAAFAGVTLKEDGAERALAADLALLSGVFLIASSKWNQKAAPDEILVRLSEVLDWEEGGRTEAHHAARIFDKEREEGERRVLAVMQRGTRGVAFCDALNKRAEYPQLPGVATVEAVQATSATVFGTVHSSLLSLLRNDALVTGAGLAPTDSLMVQRLCATTEGLELVRTTNSLMTQALAQLMIGLRLFSFS